MTFEELEIGTPASSELRSPGCLHTSTIRKVGAGFVDAGFTPLYVPPLGSPSTILRDVLPRSLERDINPTFDLTGHCGAALMTQYPTYRKDSLLEDRFETYVKHHYKSWVEFARLKGYGQLHPVLVSGFDMTSDFAMVAYSDKDTSTSNAVTFVPMFPSDPNSFPGTWRARFLPHINHGPRQHSPPPSGQTTHFLPLQLGGMGRVASEYNQCAFIRYYTMCSRKWWELFSQGTLMRAGAGPHDLGPGDNRGDAFPELAAQSDIEPTLSSDDDLGGQSDTTDDTGSEPDVVIRNTPYVRFLPRPSFYALNLAFRMKNVTAGGTPSQTTYSR